MTARSLAFVFAAALSAVAGAQTWSRSYESGLDAARAGRWAEAREAFRQAIDSRPDDQSAPTVLPGPATIRKLWRNGAPYSPNFLAAYALYRQALLAGDPAESSKMMRDAAAEFETLVDKGQTSPESFFFLDVIYTKLDDTAKRQVAKEKQAKAKTSFKVDAEPIAPEEMAAINARTANPTVPGVGTIVRPGTGPTVSIDGSVVALPNKFALVVGQSESRIPGAAIAYGSSDAQRVRDALVSYAGYPSENVTILQNVNATAIKAAAEALAAKMKEDSVVTIFYAGAGVNVAGKDYIAGNDTESASDTTTMLAKTELFDPFVQRGARVFSFFEVNRPIDADGVYFGREDVHIGTISQMHSTRSGDTVTPTYRNGQAVGLFTNAYVMALANLRSNRIPINEFAWQIVNGMRRGDTGTTGGGGTQVCTLPILTGMASDAKF